MKQGAVTPAVTKVEASLLTNQQIAKMLNGYQSDKPLGMLNDSQDFRISLAGAQEKTAFRAVISVNS